VNLACLGRPATDGGPLGPGLRAHPALAVLIPLAVAAVPGVPGHALSGRRGRRDCGQPGRYRGHPGQPAQPGPSDHGSTAAGIGTLAGMLVGAGIGGGGVVGERWHSELARWAAVGRGDPKPQPEGPSPSQPGQERQPQRDIDDDPPARSPWQPRLGSGPGWFHRAAAVRHGSGAFHAGAKGHEGSVPPSRSPATKTGACRTGPVRCRSSGRPSLLGRTAPGMTRSG